MSVVILGDPITVNIHIFSSYSNVYATGAIVLRDNGKTIAVQHLGQTGSTVFNLQSDVLGVGIHNLVAHYAGDKNFVPSVSAVMVKEITNK
jgi:hypothetical protein